MKLFEYESRDEDDRIERGHICDVSERAAMEHLHICGIKAFDVHPVQRKHFTYTTMTRERWQLLRHLNRTAVRAQTENINLRETLERFSEAARSRSVRRDIQAILENSGQNVGLAEVLPLYPAELVPIYERLIAAKASDTPMSVRLTYLADFCQFQTSWRDRQSQPVRIFTIMAAICVGFLFLLVFANVALQFGEIFGSFRSRLPAPTRLVLGVSEQVTGFGFVGFLFAILVVLVAIRIGQLFHELRIAFDAILWRLPALRAINDAERFILSRHLSLAAMGAKTESEIALLAAGACGNAYLQNQMHQMVIRTKAGFPLLDDLRGKELISGIDTWMVGELMNDIGLSAAFWATTVTGEWQVVQNRRRSHSAVMLGLLFVFLAFAGFGVIALFMPILSLSSVV